MLNSSPKSLPPNLDRDRRTTVAYHCPLQSWKTPNSLFASYTPDVHSLSISAPPCKCTCSIPPSPSPARGKDLHPLLWHIDVPSSVASRLSSSDRDLSSRPLPESWKRKPSRVRKTQLLTIPHLQKAISS